MKKMCHLSNGSKINALVEFDMIVRDQSCIACSNLPECRENWLMGRRDCKGFIPTTILFTTEEKDKTSASSL